MLYGNVVKWGDCVQSNKILDLWSKTPGAHILSYTFPQWDFEDELIQTPNLFLEPLPNDLLDELHHICLTFNSVTLSRFYKSRSNYGRRVNLAWPTRTLIHTDTPINTSRHIRKQNINMQFKTDKQNDRSNHASVNGGSISPDQCVCRKSSVWSSDRRYSHFENCTLTRFDRIPILTGLHTNLHGEWATNLAGSNQNDFIR